MAAAGNTAESRQQALPAEYVILRPSSIYDQRPCVIIPCISQQEVAELREMVAAEDTAESRRRVLLTDYVIESFNDYVI